MNETLATLEKRRSCRKFKPDMIKQEELDAIIAEEHLKPAETASFMQRAFMDGFVTETGTGIARILPPTNPFLPESGEKKQTVIGKLKSYLQKFMGTTEPVVNINITNNFNGHIDKYVAEE